jgi:hypothetical protein
MRSCGHSVARAVGDGLMVENQPESWGSPCGIEMDRVPSEQDFLVVGVLMSVII